MSLFTPIIMYDLAGSPGAPIFSPAATRLRLSMLAKGVPFIVKEITYIELRREWCGKSKPLGVEEATVPFIKLPDGTFLMDSLVIAPWLDVNFPNLPSIYLPTAPLPLDTKAPAYLEALVEEELFRKSLRWPGLFNLYAPGIIKTFTKADAEYFTSDARLGEGEWSKIATADYESSVAALKAQMPALEAQLASPDGFFFSATHPNFKDFHVMGMHRMLASVDASATKRVFDGNIGAWVQRMRDRFGEGLAEVERRDPVV
ncbi:hypothetical protein RQP46_001843 [Phenoliferia psychrophenolica]